MLSAAMQQKLNEQVKHEFYSSFVYYSMAAWLDGRELTGMGGWMRVQADEERQHALKIFEYVLDRGATVQLQAIPQPPVQFQAPLEIFEQALQHERAVTALINGCYGQAVDERDFASQQFLDWFVHEQIEEEKTAAHIVAQLALIGNDQPSLLLLDRELGSRGRGGHGRAHGHGHSHGRGRGQSEDAT